MYSLDVWSCWCSNISMNISSADCSSQNSTLKTGISRNFLGPLSSTSSLLTLWVAGSVEIALLPGSKCSCNYKLNICSNSWHESWLCSISLQIKLTQQREKMFSEKSFVVVEALDFFKQATLAVPSSGKRNLFHSIIYIDSSYRKDWMNLKLAWN